MRFDDSFETVLAGDMSTSAGAQFTWRQLVDLIGRSRVSGLSQAIVQLRRIRAKVPVSVRAASARGLERAQPPAELVALFVEDELAVAAPVVRSAQLRAEQWIALLPAMSPAVRSLLRNRRDLPADVARALESYGATDFVIAGAVYEVETAVVATAVEAPSAEPAPEAAGFMIADVIERIESRRRDFQPAPPPEAVPADSFRFETDAAGVIRHVEGVERSAVIGVALDPASGTAQVDGIAAGAYRRRAQFTDARLTLSGRSNAAGQWRISAVPGFDAATGRFTGYSGGARRPRAEESAAPVRRGTPATDALRQLVHELRTPTNAITGFAEMIESEMLGPVPPVYRERAREIRLQTASLVGAIDDIDIAARIESHVLDLHFGAVAPMPILLQIVADLQPLATLRGATIAVSGDSDARIDGDDRAIERLLSRLLAALVAAASAGETLALSLSATRDIVTLVIDRPWALAARPDHALFGAEEQAEGAPLLGGDFAFRLARNLAAELGGSLVIGSEQLTLRLRAAVNDRMEQATV